MMNEAEEKLGEMVSSEPTGKPSDSPLARGPSHPSPIETLPFDILYAIVVYIVAEAWEDAAIPNTPLYLSHTCRSLRAFTMDAPIFWSRIHFHNPRPSHPSFPEQTLWLQRSRDYPLHLSIQTRNYSYEQLGFSKNTLSRIMKLIVPHIGRWRSLDVKIIRLNGYRIVFDALRQACAPELEVLAAHIPRNDTKWRFVPFGGGAPKLWSLEASPHVAIQLANEGNRTWSGLRRIQINSVVEAESRRDEGDLFRISHVLEILRRCGELEEVCVNCVADPNAEDDYHSPSLIHVPNLRRADIIDHWMHLPDYTWQQKILLSVNAPWLAQTKGDFTLTSYNIPILLSHPSFPLPHIQSITLDDDAHYHPSACNALVKFTNLRNLTFEFLSSESASQFIRLPSTSFPHLQTVKVDLQSGNDVKAIRNMAQARQDDPTLTALVEIRLTVREGVLEDDDRAWFAQNVANCYTLFFEQDSELCLSSERASSDTGSATRTYDIPNDTVPTGDVQEASGSEERTEERHQEPPTTTGAPADVTELAPEILENSALSPAPGRRRYRKARQKRNAKKAARIEAGLPVVRSPPGRSECARVRRVPWRPRRISSIGVIPSEEITTNQTITEQVVEANSREP